MHGDGTELNHEEKPDEEDDDRRTSPGTDYENMMNWEDEVLVGAVEDLLHVDDKYMSMSYEDFPPLPDFPCISSSSPSSKSSSSAPPSTSFMNQQQHHISSASSSSSSASWEVGNSDHIEQGNHGKNLLPTADSIEIHQDELNRLDSGDCMDVMEGFGEMGLVDTDDIWDPSCFFPCGEELNGFNKEVEKCLVDRENVNHDNEEKNNKPSEDLALVFLEWLKSNKETISAEDLRSIKLKRSTIECAAKGLGGGTQGMKQLFKLILEWVENNHLQRKRLQEEGQASAFPASYSSHQNHNPNSHEFSSFTPESNFVPTVNPWNVSPSAVVPPSDFVSDPMASGDAVYPPTETMYGFNNGDPSIFVPQFSQNPYLSSAFDASYHLQKRSHHQPPPPTHHFSRTSHRYGASYHHQDPHVHHLQPAPPPSRYVSNYHQRQYQPCHQMFQGSDGSLIRLGSSATKEARMKRMSRQRKIFSHHQRHA
ncbi:B3 domain-containing transcription factor ABI3-like [Papaver somniferum]|uniref:B3 domain-containing transcription factor ABI3-like n=1 Tax=Papaver somniferum TaxID=3469 RepID=UPI000E6FC643|nr:B3 domain-containing transcription factor ABI3-like [Papaver somniferum]